MSMYDDIAMRTIVDIPKPALETLTELCRQDNISRAEAIRRAIDLYIKSKHGEEKGEAFVLGYGVREIRMGGSMKTD